jgi:diguanylate cyclase (GGDEF)-like protein
MAGTLPFFQIAAATVDHPDVERESCLVRIYPAEASGSLIALHSPRMTLGRDSLCDIEVPDDFISRVHCVLERHDDRWVLTDRSSLNGTFVNDERVEERDLVPGDQIRVGNHIFKFLSSDHVEAQYHEAVYEMMTIDALTQTYNRRYFEEALRREVLRSARHQRPFALLLLDIDFFKRVNDRFGHLVGDEVLRALGARLKARVREDELLARFGGEEFALAMPEITQENAVEVAEEFRKLVSDEAVHSTRGEIPLTISIGMAHSDGRQPIACSELLDRADRKLYEAKHSGRNCVRA